MEPHNSIFAKIRGARFAPPMGAMPPPLLYKMLQTGDGRSNCVGIIVNVEIRKISSTTVEMAGEDHCNMDDDPPT